MNDRLDEHPAKHSQQAAPGGPHRLRPTLAGQQLGDQRAQEGADQDAERAQQQSAQQSADNRAPNTGPARLIAEALKGEDQAT